MARTLIGVKYVLDFGKGLMSLNALSVLSHKFPRHVKVFKVCKGILVIGKKIGVGDYIYCSVQLMFLL